MGWKLANIPTRGQWQAFGWKRKRCCQSWRPSANARGWCPVNASDHIRPQTCGYVVRKLSPASTFHGGDQVGTLRMLLACCKLDEAARDRGALELLGVRWMRSVAPGERMWDEAREVSVPTCSWTSDLAK